MGAIQPGRIVGIVGIAVVTDAFCKSSEDSSVILEDVEISGACVMLEGVTVVVLTSVA